MKYPSFFCTWLFPPTCYSTIAVLWYSSYAYNRGSHLETMNRANLTEKKKIKIAQALDDILEPLN